MSSWKDKFRKINLESPDKHDTAETGVFIQEQLTDGTEEFAIVCQKHSKISCLYLLAFLVPLVSGYVCYRILDAIFPSNALIAVVFMLVVFLLTSASLILPLFLKNKYQILRFSRDNDKNVWFWNENDKRQLNQQKITKYKAYMETIQKEDSIPNEDKKTNFFLSAFFGFQNGNFIKISGDVNEFSFQYPIEKSNYLWNYKAKNGAEDVNLLLLFMDKSNSIDMRVQEMDVKKELEELLTETSDNELEK
jgi:hypothetical protein